MADKTCRVCGRVIPDGHICLSCGDYDDQQRFTAAMPKTNGDRIRQMTDEELIELVNSSVCHYTDCLDNDCEECGRKWIMKEVSEDAGTDD